MDAGNGPAAEDALPPRGVRAGVGGGVHDAHQTRARHRGLRGVVRHRPRHPRQGRAQDLAGALQVSKQRSEQHRLCGTATRQDSGIPEIKVNKM